MFHSNSYQKVGGSKKLKSIQELQQFFPELIAITDGTEQQIPRPKDKRKRNILTMLGKKKKHTVQNALITINLDGMIIHNSAHPHRDVTDHYKMYNIKTSSTI